MEEKFDHMVMEGNMMVWKWKKMLIIWQWKITWRYENLNILKAIWGLFAERSFGAPHQ